MINLNELKQGEYEHGHVSLSCQEWNQETLKFKTCLVHKTSSRKSNLSKTYLKIQNKIGMQFSGKVLT